MSTLKAKPSRAVLKTISNPCKRLSLFSLQAWNRIFFACFNFFALLSAHLNFKHRKTNKRMFYSTLIVETYLKDPYGQ